MFFRGYLCMKVYDVVLNDGEKGVYSISVVEDPAMEGMFLALSKDHKVQQPIKLAEVNPEKRILMGLALEPDKKIYRNMDGEEFFIQFSKETIEKAAHLFLSNGYQNQSSLEHQLELKGLSVVESWIIEDDVNDKSRKYGLDHPVGSWMVSMKVNDDTLWNDFVKTGLIKGFSIDGLFSLQEVKLNKEDMSKSILEDLKDFFKKEAISLHKEEPKKEETTEEVKLSEEPEVKAEASEAEAVAEPAQAEEAQAEAVETPTVSEEELMAELKAEFKQIMDDMKLEFSKQLESVKEENKALEAKLSKSEGAAPTIHAPKEVQLSEAKTAKGRLTNFINTL